MFDVAVAEAALKCVVACLLLVDEYRPSQTARTAAFYSRSVRVLMSYLQELLRLFMVDMVELECGPMPNVTVALPNIGGALCSTPQSLADAHY